MAGLSGSSQKLARAIHKHFSSKAQKKIPEQAHHLLASSVVTALDTEFYKKAKKPHKKRYAHAAKYQLNGASNGILLPIRFGHQMKLNRVRHRGRHGPPYFKEVDKVLRKIYQDILTNGKDVCKADKGPFLQDLKDAEDDIRDRITCAAGGTPALWLYEKWSEKLWTADYRDEGATVGKLRSPYGIVDDAAAGLEWEQKMKPIKRRHTMKGTKAVLNSDWYTTRAYPDPKSLT